MAGFKKAKAEQAALKMGLYGPQGSGKTFTALLVAEGLAKVTGKRIAFWDTERGSDFYCQSVKERKLHPEAFDFDAHYGRSITEGTQAIKDLKDDTGIVVIDSITHIWEATVKAYSGRTTGAGTIPFHAWGKIKKPYKELIAHLLSVPKHVIFCGRQGSIWEKDEESEELRQVGFKMKAEGETAYEPHILIRMEAVRNPKTWETTITALPEKDRTGILSGKVIPNPTFDNLVKPMLYLLGDTQARIEDDEVTAQADAEKIAEQDAEKAHESAALLKKFNARLVQCETLEEIRAIGKEITTEVKSKMTTADVAELRERYLDAERIFAPAGGSGKQGKLL